MPAMEPGVYLRTGQPSAATSLRSCGRFWARAVGHLASEARGPAATVLFEGVLLGDRQPDRDDAQVALERFEAQGVAGVETLDGFFRAVIVEPHAGRAWVVNDALATRPSYVYRGPHAAAVAPSPAWLAAEKLPMRLDRQALYETFRLCHPVGPRSLLREVERSRPRTTYRIDGSGRVEALRPPAVPRREQPGLGLDDAADRIRDSHARIVDAVLDHPRLRGRPVHLPLTSGMDSRHLLGTLLARGTPPARICHVRIDAREHAVASTLAGLAGVPLDDPTVAQLDLAGLLRAWIERSGGLVHVHQLYLGGVARALPPGGVVAFDGYLADLLLGFHRLPLSLAQRRYVRGPLRWLFADHRAREASCLAAIEHEANQWDGSADVKASGSDAFNRGPWYTGGAFPLLDPGAAAFAPGAHRDALEIFQTVPEALLRQKRARLHMFRRDFPALAKVPTQNGIPLDQMTTLPDRKASSVFATLAAQLRRPPEIVGPRHWLRRIPLLHRIHRRVVDDGQLLREGVLPAGVVRWLWQAHQRGAPAAFALMSLLSAEVAYRVCVARQSPDAVARWLLAED